ncbi:hypothetical protein [Streptomyces sp. NBC_01589]|uniref:hypothetical protein n=1 Tax=unclassified Streptomyces TaxID=2593676 RepID=UPI00386F0F38
MNDVRHLLACAACLGLVRRSATDRQNAGRAAFSTPGLPGMPVTSVIALAACTGYRV